MDSGAEIEDERPMVSVVIPVYNDPEGISATLGSVLDQSYPTDRYEVIVADNGSTDDTRETVRSYSETYLERVTLVVENQIQSSAAARNKGIERASGSIFAFIDADMTVEETWLESLVAAFQDAGCDYMGYTVETYSRKGHDTLAAKYDRLFAFPMEEYMQQSQFTGTGCLVTRRDVFDTVGKFNSELVSGEDKEFGQRVHEAGFDQHFERSITIYHPARASVIEQLKKSFRIGRGIRQAHEIYPDRFDAKTPFRLRSYLPTNPHWFRSQIRDKSIDFGYEAVGLYLIASLKKFARSAGSLYEYVDDGSTSRK